MAEGEEKKLGKKCEGVVKKLDQRLLSYGKKWALYVMWGAGAILVVSSTIMLLTRTFTWGDFFPLFGFCLFISGWGAILTFVVFPKYERKSYK